MKIETKKLVESFEAQRVRSFSDSDIAKALDGVEFPAYIQVVGSYSNHFGWNEWALIEPNGDRYEGAHGGTIVEGFWADSYESAHSVLASYENELYIENPEARVLAEWEIPEQGIRIQYNCWVDSLGNEDESTKIRFPLGWGPRRKIEKIFWLMSQEEIQNTPYLLRALEVW